MDEKISEPLPYAWKGLLRGLVLLLIVIAAKLSPSLLRSERET